MSPRPHSQAYLIKPYAAVAEDAAVRVALDDVFFSSSNTKSFASDEARAVFRERWLDRYLRNLPDCCFVALDARGSAVGYIVGSLNDPAQDPLFADLPHFAAFAHLTPHYPAQLHVNLAEAARSQGIGQRLIATFVEHARAAGAPGVHAITSRGARNVRFYSANGFPEVGSAAIGDKELVFLARNLR